jgi:PIN domain nuclease of toxin-antitoxin system
MRLLLDTHILIWLIRDTRKLKPAEIALIGSPDVEPFVSVVTIWELRIKWQLFFASGARKGELDPADAIRFCGDNGVTLAALSPTDYAAPLVPPLAHTDPFDEMLLVHAQQLGAKLLTRDDRLLGHALAASPL